MCACVAAAAEAAAATAADSIIAVHRPGPSFPLACMFLYTSIRAPLTHSHNAMLVARLALMQYRVGHSSENVFFLHCANCPHQLAEEISTRLGRNLYDFFLPNPEMELFSLMIKSCLNSLQSGKAAARRASKVGNMSKREKSAKRRLSKPLLPVFCTEQ